MAYHRVSQPLTMFDFSELINHWGYFAIVLFVILGNVGLPVPEESILVLSGYLAWRGDLKLSLVIVAALLALRRATSLDFGLDASMDMRPLTVIDTRYW